MREKSLFSNNKETSQSERCTMGLPTLMMQNNQKVEVDLFTIESNFSLKAYKTSSILSGNLSSSDN